MARFRPSSGGATARFAAAQAGIIRSLVGQVVELVGGEEADDAAPSGDLAPGDLAPGGVGPGDLGPGDLASGDLTAAAAPAGPAGPGTPGAPDDLEAQFRLTDNTELPVDPILARLLPDAYADDQAASAEFRRYTEVSLRSGKVAAAQTVLDTLPPGGGRVRLTEADAQAWLRALNDVRLALGVVLGVTDDFDDDVERLEPSDPRAAYIGVYQWLAYLQETLVEALD